MSHLSFQVCFPSPGIHQEVQQSRRNWSGKRIALKEIRPRKTLKFEYSFCLASVRYELSSRVRSAAGNYGSKNEWRPQIEAPLDSSRFQLFARVTRLVAAAGGGGGGEGSHKKVVIREGGMENALYADFQRRREPEGGSRSRAKRTKLPKKSLKFLFAVKSFSKIPPSS